MKIINLFLSGILFITLSFNTKAQDLTYSPASGLLSSEQSAKIEKAEKYIKKAESKIKKAEEIEKKYEKKKKKKKKYEKKIWEAKKYRIQAEKDYLRGYNEAADVYSEIIKKSDFYDSGDESEAKSLNEDALSLLKDAEKKMSKYNKKISDSKYLKKLTSSKLNSAISSAAGLREDAFSKQTEAVDIVLNQGRKKEQEEKDNKAWATAQNINTIASYQDYIDNFPTGKYVSRARQMIRQLKEKEKKKVVPKVSNYVFRVQIAASRTPLPKYELSTKYSNTSEIEQSYSGGYYKYWVKSFPTYSQAAAFRDQLLTTSVPDAFVVVFDKDGNQLEVTDEMKQN